VTQYLHERDSKSDSVRTKDTLANFFPLGARSRSYKRSSEALPFIEQELHPTHTAHNTTPLSQLRRGEFYLFREESSG
jgi:hypothetical protein